MLRIGALGAARVTQMAIVEPAARRTDTVLQAIAARRKGVAADFAAEHGFSTYYDSYEALIADPDIDLVYIALPPAMHFAFAVKTLDAGKHVLCEKPFALNADEAQAMNAAAARNGRRIIEAFHYFYHPVFQRARKLVQSGALGRVIRIESVFNHTMPRTGGEFRYLPALGGGVMMDYGCYTLHWIRRLVDEEPRIVSAEADWTDGGIDLEMQADCVFPSGVAARIECRMTPGWDMHARLIVLGELGRLEIINPILPHRGHSIVTDIGGVRHEQTIAGDTTFDHQLDAVIAALSSDTSLPTEGDDPVANMRAIDAVYAAAGRPIQHQPGNV